MHCGSRAQSKLAIKGDKAKGGGDSSELNLMVEERVLDPVEEDRLEINIPPDEPRHHRLRLYAGITLLSLVGLAIVLITWGSQMIEWAWGPKPRIILAVRPFRNLSSDPSQDFIAEGLTEEMITPPGQLHPDGDGVIRLPPFLATRNDCYT
jgi:hypothetical protein